MSTIPSNFLSNLISIHNTFIYSMRNNWELSHVHQQSLDNYHIKKWSSNYILGKLELAISDTDSGSTYRVILPYEGIDYIVLIYQDKPISELLALDDTICTISFRNPVRTKKTNPIALIKWW